MLTFLTGTYFSSKKEYISEKISSLIDEGRKVYLIVPEQSSFDRDRDFLFRYGEKKSNLLTVTSFTHLARDVLEENGLRVKPEADEAAKNVIMSLAIEDVSDSLDIYLKHSGRLSLIKELIAQYAEIKQAGLSADNLSAVSASLSSGSLKSKASELSKIFLAYEALLGERFSDSSDNVRVMTEFLESHNIFSDSYVFFDDFRGFTGAQVKLLCEIACQCEESFVSVNAPDSVSAGDSEAFAHAVSNCRSIRREASKKNIKIIQKNIPGENPVKELSLIGSSLFCGEKDVYSGQSDAVTIISAENKYSECDIVSLQIKKLISEEGYRCRDIAVTERSGSYAGVMTASLKKYGIPVFEDKRVALYDYPLIRLILCAVDIASAGFSSEKIFSYIKTGLVDIGDRECSDLENYVFIWNINRNDWLSPFTSNPDGFGVEMDEEKEKRLEKLNETREKIVKPLKKLKNRLYKGSGEESCRAVFNFLTEIKAAENFRKYAGFLCDNGNEAGAVECAGVWDAVTSSLDALYEAVGQRNLKPVRFAQLLKIILCSGDVGRIPSGIDQIVIGQANRTRFLEPEAVFILGANDGVFPPVAMSGGMFSPAERRILSDNNFILENLPETVYAEERMIAYSAVTGARKKLYISYSRSTPSGGEKTPSVLVEEIKKIIPGAAFIKDSSLSSLDRITSEDSAFEECASHFGENTVLSESLCEYIKTGKYASRIETLENAVNKKPFMIKDPETAAELFGSDMRITPSKAEKYYKCPFLYFCNYGMHVSRLTPADLDARVNGLLVHHTLEIMFTRYTNDEIKRRSDSEITADIDSITEDYIEKYMGGRKDKGVLLNRSLDKAKKTIFEILGRLRLEFGSSRFVTRDVELSINEDGDVKPYTLALSDGGSITVGGFVDRVDVMDDKGKAYLRVIDYKTGGKSFKLSDVYDGLNMQMLIYLMCLWDNGKSRYGDIVPAGILYVPAKNSGETLPRNADEEEIAQAKLKNGRMNGMILEDENVLKGMEAAAEGRFINALIDKKGNMKGTFICLDDFKRLHKKTDSMLTGMGEKLHKGIIEALPVNEGAYKDTCDYCDYRDICRRTADSDVRSLHDYTHKQAIENLKEEN